MTMAEFQRSSFLDLPAELRNAIYEYISLDAGVYVRSGTSGHLSSPTSISQVCRQIDEEYRSVLYTSAPVITAVIDDFDFNKLTYFLDRQSGVQKTSHDDYGVRPRSHRKLRIMLDLHPFNSPRRLNHLKIWLESVAYSDDSLFTTQYSLYDLPHSDRLVTSEEFFMVGKLLDTIYGKWFLSMAPGRVRAEIGKVCDCMSNLEEEAAALCDQEYIPTLSPLT